MTKSRLAQSALVLAALGFTAAAPAVLGLSSAYAAETVRAEIGGPLTDAQKMIKAGKNKEALSKLHELDSVGGKTPHEIYLIERTRAGAALAAKDNDQSIHAFEALLATGKAVGNEAKQYQEGLISMYITAKQFDKANSLIQKSGDPKFHIYLIQNMMAQGNTAGAMKELKQSMDADNKAGRTPSKDSLELLANLQNKTGDKTGYVATIEKLATAYPTKMVWTDLLQRVAQKPGFSNRLAVDVWRLKLANNLLSKPSEYVEMAQLVIQSGANTEAVKLIAKGYAAKMLGEGSDAARHQRLKDLADKNVIENAKNAPALEASLSKAKDNDGLVALGYTLVQAGNTDKGLSMMESAIKADSLKYPDEAKLHLGLAYMAAGKKAQATSTFKSVGGNDGSMELARYWVMTMVRPAS